MTETTWSTALLLISAAIFAAGVIYFFAGRGTHRLTRRLLTLTAAIVAALALIQGALSMIDPKVDLAPSGLVGLMQIFSLDGDYQVIDKLWRCAGSSLWKRLRALYVALVYTSAPIAGGAVIYDVLAGVSPSLRLWFIRRRKLYVFSQLNEMSMTLAESLSRDEKSPFALVFAGVSPAQGEDETDLVLRAREAGAICVEEALPHCRQLRRAQGCWLFLMNAKDGDDFDDTANLVQLSEILEADEPIWNPHQPCGILLFSNDSETIEGVRAAKQRFDATRGGAVTVNVERDFAQTACMQLKRAPLFTPLGDYAPGRPLRVALFGGSAFAKEMFKAVFWCGQMLDTPLEIAVVDRPSGEDVPAFETWLNQLNPDVARSCTWTRDGEGRAPECLRMRMDGGKAEAFGQPYASLCFIEEDVARENPREMLRRRRQCQYGSPAAFALEECDYFLIMQGTDAENAALAGHIHSALRARSLTGDDGRAQQGRGRQVVAFVVRDENLAQVMADRYDGDAAGAVMMPFGALSTRFDRQTVFMDEAWRATRRAEDPAAAAEHRFADINSKSDSMYDRWAQIGQAFHMPYKVYCAGDVTSPQRATKLAWLEHRRWVAFQRMQGFTCPFEGAEALKAALAGEPPRVYAYKDVAARLHPCIVESAPEPTDVAALTEAVCRQGLSAITAADPDRFDLLDVVSALRAHIEGSSRDVKKYDMEEIQRMMESLR